MTAMVVISRITVNLAAVAGTINQLAASVSLSLSLSLSLCVCVCCVVCDVMVALIYS